MVAGAIERDFGEYQTVERVGEGRASGIKNGEMVEAGGTCWRLRSSATFPGVQTYVVVITPGGDECGVGAEPLSELKSKDTAVKGEGSLYIRNLEVDMADGYPGIDGHRGDGFVHKALQVNSDGWETETPARSSWPGLILPHRPLQLTLFSGHYSPLE